MNSKQLRVYEEDVTYYLKQVSGKDESLDDHDWLIARTIAEQSEEKLHERILTSTISLAAVNLALAALATSAEMSRVFAFVAMAIVNSVLLDFLASHKYSKTTTLARMGAVAVLEHRQNVQQNTSPLKEAMRYGQSGAALGAIFIIGLFALRSKKQAQKP